MRLWGGRFSGKAGRLAETFGASLRFDQRLWEQDIAGSIAHVRMLGHCRIIPKKDAEQIESGLEAVRAELASGELEFDPDGEDIHTEIERLLTARVGPVAGKLPTARSRNDQVSTDMRLHLRDVIDELRAGLVSLERALLAQAEKHLASETILPGYTHFQHAQPVLLAHHLLAYIWMFERDRARLADCRKRVNVLPLGAGALAGASLPIDRAFLAKQLGFDAVTDNSLDSVSDRDFAVEFLAAASLIMVHLSRLGEELVIWSSQEFGFVALSEEWCTGSSLMPQKRNPDGAELIRGKTGRVFGDLIALLTVLKGQPLAYNKDLQEDKEAVFDAVDTLSVCLPAVEGMIADADFKRERMGAALEKEFSTATEVADYLVRRGVPFREAHAIVGQVVRECEQQGKTFEELPLAQWQALSPHFTEDVFSVLSPRGAVEAKLSAGGTAPTRVQEQIEKAKAALAAS